jgi:hypothetical protein
MRPLLLIGVCCLGACETNKGGPTALEYPTNPAIYWRSVAIEANAPTLLLDKKRSYGYGMVFSITPPLPAGLSMDSWGQISGTPAVITDGINYIVTAKSDRGSTSVVLNLTVTEPPPLYFGQYVVFFTDRLNQEAKATNNGVTITQCVSQAPLPEGLFVDTGCMLYGRPKQASEQMVYVLEATVDAGAHLLVPVKLITRADGWRWN